MPNSFVTITVRPRLHLGLLSMDEQGPRKNGGVGFAVSEPTGRILVETHDALVLEDEREEPFGKDELLSIRRMVEGVSSRLGLDLGARVVLSGGLRSHVGLGSGTAIRLGILEGVLRLRGMGTDRKTLTRLSERGGTSGVGINTYFEGGLIADLGVPHDGAPFVPSAHRTPTSLPLALPRVDMAHWPLCLCIPKTLKPKTQEEEWQFFRKATPLRATESYEAAYHALFGVYAGAVEQDFERFCTAIEALQSTSWKRKERLEYGRPLAELTESLRNLGADCIGMSSLGPLLYCFGKAATLQRIIASASTLECDIVGAVPANSGRLIQGG